MTTNDDDRPSADVEDKWGFTSEAQIEGRRALSRAIQRMLPALLAGEIEDRELFEAAATIEGWARRWEARVHPSRYDAKPRPNRGDFLDSIVHESHPILGQASPMAPPVTMRREDGIVVAEAVFGLAYEGIRGLVHGGWLAAMCDIVLGFAAGGTGRSSMTGTLTLRYRRPTPIGVEVRGVGRIVRIEGRKTLVAAELSVAGEVTVESEGVFIALPLEGMYGTPDGPG
ncbi:MAG: PaaI family thioesterase [Gammaproteobacteria bacterium]